MKAYSPYQAVLFPAGRRDQLGILEDFKEVRSVMQIFFNPLSRFVRNLVRSHLIYPGIYSRCGALAAQHPSLSGLERVTLSQVRGGFDLLSSVSINRGAASFNAVLAFPTTRNLRRSHIANMVVKIVQGIQGHLWLHLLKRYRNMITNPVQITRQHLANNKGPFYTLTRKRCACGKSTTARQLRQYGRCITCVRGAP